MEPDTITARFGFEALSSRPWRGSFIPAKNPVLGLAVSVGDVWATSSPLNATPADPRRRQQLCSTRGVSLVAFLPFSPFSFCVFAPSAETVLLKICGSNNPGAHTYVQYIACTAVRQHSIRVESGPVSRFSGLGCAYRPWAWGGQTLPAYCSGNLAVPPCSNSFPLASFHAAPITKCASSLQAPAILFQEVFLRLQSSSTSFIAQKVFPDCITHGFR
ncbi:hypothetical protein BDBG_17983 [Blastomyces gilchristii SLH14081]|uniref:Uncharacterized protein n=1 Tax=Blastomyces gilchristii (strain SLH14081) TaxID=559298 RepID=A0A179V413_BLAGS|nr:uncharacterized protein BDBG_17983 [Blastomyces gilchristii SLH14081]OAT14188.1 hypothetical protein BDBG_17983 [Blastomyces gilchristii SLH14081]